ncbi:MULTISPECIES: hypothetical protein [Cyanophyceae]|uniref:hypothetical protein n=1 Tax=Cyanophyceae TaxID=3028117 RepID=UPI001689A6A9|nr:MULTISPECIES: hypothetical protein [Cyanophyceae]MBD1915941.1 hypothetical protein [Phormidium sp. FACHB-77]MBD2030385.1 hypothetical protein [Phormidium sp. FACHB-322]MBD2053387.1 hypothetical protein [Leptolyngbya sp. FACHB-60]
MSDGQQETTLDRRVALPEPDVSNITVLTENLPNEPVLPWHHFDSPWLERDDAISAESDAEATSEGSTDAEPTEQLTLDLEVLVGVLDDGPKDAAAESTV